MKYICTLFCAAILFCVTADAQSAPGMDKSPMDLSTYPANYAGLRAQGKKVDPAQLMARVIYSRPQKNGRAIFGSLVPYKEVWRMGANENTEIEFFTDVKINNVPVKKGRYTMFAIPAEDKWTIIISKDLNNWGAYMYDMKNDLLRVDIPVQKTSDISEAFYIYFDKAASGYNLNAGWDNIKVSLPISM